MRIQNSAFTLLEILLASIIFIVTVGGVFVTLDAIRKPVADKESALSAAVFGKQVLEALRSQVDARTNANYYGTCVGNPCTDFSLALGTHQVNSNTLAQSGLAWPSTVLSGANTVCDAHGCLVYTVTCADGTTITTNPTCASGGTNPDMSRAVNLSINWPDAT